MQTVFSMYKFLQIACFFCCFQASFYGQSPLGYQLEEGDIFLVEQQAEQQIVQSLDGTSHQLTNRISGVLQFRVMQVRDTTYLLEFMFRDLVFQIESSLQGVLLDIHASEPEPSDTQSQIFSAMLNVPVQMEMGRQGKIHNVNGGDSLVARVVEQAGLTDGFNKTVMRRTLEQEYGSRALAQSYEQMTFFYPDRPIAVGDQWKNTYEGKLSTENTWQLDSLNTDRAVIRGTATLKMKTADPSSSMDLEGTQTTTVLTSRPTGFLKEMKVENQASGISTSAQTGDLEIPTTITSMITYRLIEQKHVQ
jgi:hypothetical protein